MDMCPLTNRQSDDEPIASNVLFKILLMPKANSITLLLEMLHLLLHSLLVKLAFDVARIY
jgi:hypothetical protein